MRVINGNYLRCLYVYFPQYSTFSAALDRPTKPMLRTKQCDIKIHIYNSAAHPINGIGQSNFNMQMINHQVVTHLQLHFIPLAFIRIIIMIMCYRIIFNSIQFTPTLS